MGRGGAREKTSEIARAPTDGAFRRRRRSCWNRVNRLRGATRQL